MLIVKNHTLLPEAERLFGDSGIKITSEGEHHLGAVVGTETYKEQFVRDKVSKSTSDVKQLTNIAKDEPHASYVAYTKGLCHRWTFTQRKI